MDEFVFRTLIGEFIVRVRRHRSTLTPQQARHAARVAFALRAGIEVLDPKVFAVARRLEHVLSSSSLREFNEREESFEGGPFAGGLAIRLEDALSAGLLVVEERQCQSLTERREESTDKAVSPPRERESTDTLFEVRLVDEIGQGIAGIRVEFAFEGKFSDVASNAAGVAMLAHVVASGASISVSDHEALDVTLDLRWTKPRTGARKKEGNTTEFIYEGGFIGPVAIQAGGAEHSRAPAPARDLVPGVVGQRRPGPPREAEVHDL